MLYTKHMLNIKSMSLLSPIASEVHGVQVGLGRFLHELDELIPGKLDIPFDDLLAALLLVYFGVKTLLDAGGADESAEGEREEAKEEVERFGKGKPMQFPSGPPSM